MALPSNHVAPDLVWTGIVQPVIAQLSAHAAWLQVAAIDILDHPVDPQPGDKGNVIEVYLEQASEDFAQAGHPIAPEAGCTLAIVARVRSKSGWGAALSGLCARIRAALLQDPGFSLSRHIRRIERGPVFDGSGRLVSGVAALRVTLGGYMTEYPPVIPDRLDRVVVDVAAEGPTGPLPNTSADIDLTEE